MAPRAAVDGGDVVSQHAAEDLADTGHRTQQLPGVSVMVLGSLEERAFEVAKQMIVIVEAREVDFDPLVPRGIGTTCGDAVPIGLVGDGVTDGRPVLRAVGMLHLRQKLTPFVRQMPATP